VFSEKLTLKEGKTDFQKILTFIIATTGLHICHLYLSWKEETKPAVQNQQSVQKLKKENRLEAVICP